LIIHEVVVHKAVLEIKPRGDSVEHMEEWDKDDKSFAPFRPAEPSLTKTCRQIRAESLPVFYGGNAFRSTSYDRNCKRFISWLAPEKRMMLKNIQLGADNVHTRFCATRARLRLDRMDSWLEKKDIELSPRTLRVAVQLRTDVAVEWVVEPTEKCELTGCCGNAKAPRVF